MTTDHRPPGLTDSEIKAPPDEPWEEAVIAPAPVRAVAAAGGCVAAAGEHLYLLRPGSERLRSLGTPAGATIAALAVEPWSPYRVAVAWPHHVGIFSGHRPYEPLVEMEFPKPGMDATHLAWTRDANGIRVVARRHGGDIVRLDPKGATDVLNVRSASAVAGDDRGALAVMVDVETEDASVWIIRAADQPPEVRSLPAMAEPDEKGEEERYELALHGPAVAFSWEVEPPDPTSETMVSWRPHEDEAQHFSTPPAALSGPLAFEDADVIYAAHSPADGRVDILRWARKGKVTRIARLGLDDEGRGTPATVTSLAWDASRRTLWIASPERGLLRLQAPGATVPVATKPDTAVRHGAAPARKVSLPTRTEDTWDGGFILDQPERVIDIRAGRGLVMAGGDALYMLRPGAETWKARPPAEDLGPVFAIAAEPGPPYRYAVASEGGITVYGLPRDQILTMRAPSRDLLVTHLAWGMLGTERTLYMRWDDGTVGRLRMDLGNIEPLPLDPMDALAADADGVLALCNVLGDPADAHVLVTADGERFEERPAVAAPEDLAETTVHVAVAGPAVAYAVEGWGVHQSRGPDDDFVLCPGIPGGGPIAFQGTSPRAALFGVGHERSTCVIHRVDPEGAVQRIVELEGEGEAPRFSAIAWDESRRILWSASPQAGIMRSEEPRGKGGKKRSLS